MIQKIPETQAVIKKAWDYIRHEIETADPHVAGKQKPFLSRLYRAINATFYSLDQKAKTGVINPFIDLNCLKYSQEPKSSKFYSLNRPLRVGFFPIASNPLWWGHILVTLMAQNKLNLDTVVWRSQGEIRYKDFPETDRVPTKDRHFVTKKMIEDYFYPLYRYTDLGSEPNNEQEGSAEMHNFLALNQDKKIALFYLLGLENKDRVYKYFHQQYVAAKARNFNFQNSLHQVTMGWIQRGDYGRVVTLPEIDKIGQEVRKEYKYPSSLPSTIIKGQYIDLEVSSTYYRNTHDSAILPKLIDDYAKARGFYGHPPIDPRTGKPFNYSEAEHFKVKLRPVTESIANQIVRLKERQGQDKTFVVTIDGPSGSGKTTIAQEVLKYLELRDIKGIHIGLDLLLKKKDWRTAVEKRATGQELSDRDKKLIGSLASKIKVNQPFLEEEDHWYQAKVLRLFTAIGKFCQSNRKSLSVLIKDAYDRQTKKYENQSFSIKKGDVVIIDGKYANREELLPFTNLRYRLDDHPDRTKALFEIRTRTLSPNTADIQMAFYELGLIPSFKKYDQRTRKFIDNIIDLTGDDWKLIKLKD